MDLLTAYTRKKQAMAMMQSAGINYKNAKSENKEAAAQKLKTAQQTYSRVCKEYNEVRNAANGQ